MRLRLRDELYACGAGDRIILLDAIEGRYFSAPEHSESIFGRVLRGVDIAAEDTSVVLGLISRGWLIETSSDFTPPNAPIRPSHELAIDTAAKGKLTSFLLVCLAQQRANRLVRHRTFATVRHMVESARGKRQGASLPAAKPVITNIARAFAASEFLFPHSGRCLARSLAFMTLCHRTAFYPSLVFGVRTNPFLAHCWIEADGCVLNDTLEEVGTFSPIMAL